MSEIRLSAADIERVRDSIDLTRERFEREGFTGEDESLDALFEFCNLLLKGGSVGSFLRGQDMEDPQPGGD